jgi:UDP-N-acetylglucosamine 3-dehydrogenase
MTGIAVMGTGHWGQNHARVFKELWQEKVISKVKICDINEARVCDMAKTLGIDGTSKYEEILNDPEISAVSIATPSGTHYQLAREFIEAGKDVLVEKPMTMNIKEAQNLVRIADEKGRILMAGHVFRYHPAVRELKRRIDEGELGKIQNIIGTRKMYGLPRADMGVIYALGVHELDMFCYLLGRDYPQSLITEASEVYSRNIEETAMIVADFGGIKGYAFESWLVPTHDKQRELVVVGSKMSARVDYLKPQELTLFNISIVTENGLPVSVQDMGESVVSLTYAEPLKEELRHFVACVNTREKPLSDGHVGMRAVVMAEAALKSAEERKVIALPVKMAE